TEKLYISLLFVTETGEEREEFQFGCTNIWKLKEYVIKAPDKLTTEDVKLQIAMYGDSYGGTRKIYLDNINIQETEKKVEEK
ncbi:MAG: hypothetical protein ABF289_09210, partial [Clostridiales bacterium]